MEQYFSATQRMEQEEGAAPAAESRTDLYERYQLLKAIKPMVEKGLASVSDQSPSGADTDTTQPRTAARPGTPSWRSACPTTWLACSRSSPTSPGTPTP
uniref:Uncharacterized protein n=1 Tax=Malurus cyaneus samueli TaxID=2593467 RepID=A0A8C5T2Y6_9PASS